MTTSYRLIGTYSTNSGNLDTWGGPVSRVAAYDPGTSTAWGSDYETSAFNIGSTFAADPYDVLNVGSSFGSDELNLTTLTATMAAGSQASYSVSDAPVFNWNGDAATPGFGADTFTLITGNDAAGATINYADSLDGSYWGEVRDYEMSLDTTAYTGGADVSVSNFENANIQITGGSAVVYALATQSGDFDFSSAASGDYLGLSPVAATGTSAEQAFVVNAPSGGLVLDVLPAGTEVGPTADAWGNALITDGNTSLLNFYDANGGNAIFLQDKISTHLNLSGGSASMEFIYDPVETVLAGGDYADLNPTGSGAADIVTSNASGVSWIDNFVTGRETLDMTLATGSYELTNITDANGGGSAVAITDTSGAHGVVLGGYTAASVASHISTSMVSGVEHLFVH